MDGSTDGQLYRQMNDTYYRWMDGSTDGQIDRQMNDTYQIVVYEHRLWSGIFTVTHLHPGLVEIDGWMDGWMERRMNGWIDRQKDE